MPRPSCLIPLTWHSPCIGTTDRSWGRELVQLGPDTLPAENTDGGDRSWIESINCWRLRHD